MAATRSTRQAVVMMSDKLSTGQTPVFWPLAYDC